MNVIQKVKKNGMGIQHVQWAVAKVVYGTINCFQSSD